MLQCLQRDRYLHYCIQLFMLLFGMVISNTSYAQKINGTIHGTIRDGSTNNCLAGVSISRDSAKSSTVSMADGTYMLPLIDGTHTLYFTCPGYQRKIIKGVVINIAEVSHLDIILFPIADPAFTHTGNNAIEDSVHENDIVSSINKERSAFLYNRLYKGNIITDGIGVDNLQAGTDKNTARLMSRLNGVIVENDWKDQNIQSLQVSGMGERYNQVMLNGAVLNTLDPLKKSHPLDILPVEAMQEVTLQKTPVPFLPADFTGGTVSIKTLDIPVNNFFMVQVGAGFSGETRGKDFLGDRRSKYQFLTFPATVRDLPALFPTTRSQTAYSQKNIQEQTDLARLLPNNLAPINYGKAQPNDRILLGFGRILHFKKGLTMGIIAFANHSREQLVEQASYQVAPNIANKPYPFAGSAQKIILSQSSDVNYREAAQLGGTLNLAFYFRKNKISIRNFAGRMLNNTLTLRNNVSKPDEDTLAHAGINHATYQRKFWNAQVAGEHVLGANSKFTVQWNATYNYNSQKNPDERNFLLRQDSANKDLYSIARPLSPLFDPAVPFTHAGNFTNSSRLWREYSEHNFTASLQLKIPVNLLHHAQILSGGLYMQSVSRDFRSDLLLVRDTAVVSLDRLLAPARYFPGGLSVTNYFNNLERLNNAPINETNRGSYFSASNIAASYLYMEIRLLKQLSVQWGARLESANQSSTIVQYEYVPGYKFAQKFSIDDNTRQVAFHVLPSANILYSALPPLQVNAFYGRTLSRPMLQEMNAYKYYDALSFLVKSGNPYLATVVVDNYGAGARWVVNAGSHISVNGFYKKIDQPIEEVLTAYSSGNILSTPYNMLSATVKGIQADARIRMDVFGDSRLLSKISVFGAATILRSEVEAGPVRNASATMVRKHSLSGSPNNSFNGGFVIHDARFPEISLLYSKTSDYLTKVGSGTLLTLDNGHQTTSIPDYRIKGRKQFDIQVSQKIFHARVQLIAGVNNLLQEPFIVYQDLNGNEKFDSALSVTTEAGNMGFYKTGTDNTVTNIRSQSNYYVRLSYTF
jgi:outer membrane receptor protein involved in Fe transport